MPFLQRIGDRHRGPLRFSPSVHRPGLSASCRTLLSSPEPRWKPALARAILEAYSNLDREGRGAFFEALAREFGPEPYAARAAAKEFLDSGTMSAFQRLAEIMESPRRELFRRLGMAEYGTASLVSMRADLLDLVAGDAALENVDADLRHLLGSCFDPASLRLARIDWNCPASILEKLIRHDRVQHMSGWGDLRRRLAGDRRCFALFHPALPDTPLVFAEIALTRGMASESRTLLDEAAPVLDPRKADTAIFYSINGTQPGLRGLRLGGFLIGSVLEVLEGELPNIEAFTTLSPLPDFAGTFQAAARNKLPGFTSAHLDALLADFSEPLRRASKVQQPVEALLSLLDRLEDAPREVLAGPLRRLALAYFGLISRGITAADPVAEFHLSNGAKLAQIHPFADMSRGRIEQSFGLMVSYQYEPKQLAGNQEKFRAAGEIVMSTPLSRAFQKLGPIWSAAPVAA